MSGAPIRTRRTAFGFTLIEILAVVGLLALVLLVAIDFYLQLSRSTNEAANRTRESRRAVAIVDRVARDIQAATLLVKPPEMDPLEWPWLFVAEDGEAGIGADRLKFVSRGHQPRSALEAESDLEIVAWMLEATPEGGRALYRWTSPHLPEGLDRSFPRPEDDNAWIVAEGIESFGVRLLAEDGEWRDAWDSTTIVESSQLPISAEITLSFVNPDTNGFAEPGPSYTRRVLLPMRPLEVALLTSPGGVVGFVNELVEEQRAESEGEDRDGDGRPDDEDPFGRDKEDDPNCITVNQCLARHPELFREFPNLAATFQASVQSIGDDCWSRWDPILRSTDFFRDLGGVNLSDCF